MARSTLGMADHRQILIPFPRAIYCPTKPPLAIGQLYHREASLSAIQPGHPVPKLAIQSPPCSPLVPAAGWRRCILSPGRSPSRARERAEGADKILVLSIVVGLVDDDAGGAGQGHLPGEGTPADKRRAAPASGYRRKRSGTRLKNRSMLVRCARAQPIACPGRRGTGAVWFARGSRGSRPCHGAWWWIEATGACPR